ncbi:MAG: hypothetical protein PHG97_03480 [Candidatus Margulisbacteria bacterium]|nr:hypothetical protein [Candidatus Margulisiibacteriota bacterium]
MKTAKGDIKRIIFPPGITKEQIREIFNTPGMPGLCREGSSFIAVLSGPTRRIDELHGLNETELIEKLSLLKANKEYEMIAEIADRLTRPTRNVCLTIVRVFQRVGNYEAALEMLARLPSDHETDTIKNTLVKKLARARRRWVAAKFLPVITGKADWTTLFIDDNHRQLVDRLCACEEPKLEFDLTQADHLLTPEAYRFVRDHAGEHKLFACWQRAIVHEVYFRSSQRKLFSGTPQDKLLKLIRSEAGQGFELPTTA